MEALESIKTGINKKERSSVGLEANFMTSLADRIRSGDRSDGNRFTLTVTEI